jgi:serine/threonine-protein kinase
VHASAEDIMARANARIGTVLRGKYKLERVLGAGGMAVVYGATHRNQMRVAVKMLHPELSLSEDIRTRFLREGYAANSVQHEGALKVLDDDVAEDGAAFLVMELLEGAGAEQHWERHGYHLPLKAVLALGHELLDVLASAHAKGILHRDIKPANLFVTKKGELKVLDFGIARVRDAATSGTGGGGASATSTGMLLGTPAFMAPEQALAQASQMDGQTDVWAAGATMFTLLTGRLVHQGENAPQIMVAAATRAASPIASVMPDVPPEVAAIVDRGLAFQKADRWSSAAEMRDAIAQVYQSTFGEVLSTLPMRALFSGPDDGTAQTMASSTGSVRPVSSAPPARAQSSPPQPVPSQPQYAPSQPSFSAQAGLSTAKPVSSGTPSGVPRRSPLLAVGIGAAVVLVAGVGIAMKLHGGGGEQTSASSAAAAASSSPAAVPVPGATSADISAVAPMALTAALAPTASVAAPPASSVGAAAPPPIAAQEATPSPVRGQGPTKVVPAAAPSSAPKPSATTAPPPAAAGSPGKPVCTAVSYLGADGETHWKQVCK